MADSIRKLRTDSWAACLPEADQWRIYDRMKAAPWYDVAEWIRAELGIEPPCRSSLYLWRNAMREREFERRLGDLAALREDAAAAREALPEGEAAGAMEALAVQAVADGRLKDGALLARIADGMMRQRLERDKFEAAERRLSAATETVRDEALTPEEQVARMKEIFGIRG